MKSNLKVSVVVVVLNDLYGFKKTFESILMQDFDNIELNVIDGSSSDGTKEFIRTNLKDINNFISESDNGIYDAMNKGVELSDGDFIIFLNSSDIFADSKVISTAVRFLEKEPGKVFYGDSLWGKSNIITKGSYNLSWSIFPNHQTMFFPSQFLKSNPFNTKYSIAADIEHKLHAYLANNVSYMNFIVSHCDDNGISQQIFSIKKYWKNNMDILKIYKNSNAVSARFIIFFCTRVSLGILKRLYLIFFRKNG